MGNSQYCCSNYKPKDSHAQNFDKERDGKCKQVDEKAKEFTQLLEKARPHQDKIIKVQACIRGYLSRKCNEIFERQGALSIQSAILMMPCGRHIMLDKGKVIMINDN